MHRLCQLNEIDPETGHEIVLEKDGAKEYLALFRNGEQVFAYRNVCPHQGRSLNFAPDEFLFTGEGSLVCPHHGACFEVTTGLCTDGPCKGASLTAVRVCISDGEVCLA